MFDCSELQEKFSAVDKLTRVPAFCQKCLGYGIYGGKTCSACEGEGTAKFSVVIPIHKEWRLIPRTLPTWYALEPDEVVLCFDNPADVKTLKTTIKVVEKCNGVGTTRFLHIDRRPEMEFHQAYVRREGFRYAKYDRILTGDIDLSVTEKCLEAVAMVGRNNIGTVGLRKFHVPYDFPRFYREISLTLMRWFLKRIASGGFSGLYALWRPFWMDTETLEGVKQKEECKRIGEDTFLRDRMLEKHRVVYLQSIGAVDWGPKKEDNQHYQKIQGVKEAKIGRDFSHAIIDSILRVRVHYITAFLRERGWI